MKKAFFLLAFLITFMLAQGHAGHAGHAGVISRTYVDVYDVEAIFFRGSSVDIDGNPVPRWANVLCFYKDTKDRDLFHRFRAPGSNDTHGIERNMACVSNVINATHVVVGGVVRCEFAPIYDDRVETKATMLRHSCVVSAWSSALTDLMSTHELDAPSFDRLYMAVHMGAFAYGALYENKLRELEFHEREIRRGSPNG